MGRVSKDGLGATLMSASELDLPEVFAAAWRALGAPKQMLLAVSGGSDSIALMHLAAPLRAGGAELLVATVDHRLRPSSANDARFVEMAAAALGLPAAVLRWEGDKRATGVQAAARAARYRLLACEAERWRADAILTGHTADDQAETVLMRIAHRTGVRGLSGMAVETFIADGASPPQRLLRPLLGQRRATLRAHLAAVGAAFIDDPSNDDPRFERVRARAALTQAPSGEDATTALLSLADDARGLTAALDRLGHVRLAALDGAFLADGSVRLSAQGLSPALDAPLVARLLGAVGGSETPPDETAAAALGAALSDRRATLAGALIGRDGPHLLIAREPAAVLGRTGESAAAPITILSGARVLWDRRFIVENTLGASAEIRPLGPAAKSLTAERHDALSAAPGLWLGAELAAFPGDDGAGDRAIVSLTAERFHRLVARH